MVKVTVKSIITGVSLEKDVLAWVDEARGMVKRSTFVNEVLKEKMRTEEK